MISPSPESWLLSIPLLMLLGLVVGSFLNVVIRRLPLMLYRQWWELTCDQLEDQASLHALGMDAAAAAAQSGAQTIRSHLPSPPALSLSRPRSHCPACQRSLRPWELIPAISWLALRGRCASCGAAIGVQLVLVELLTAALFGLLAWRFAGQWVVVAWCLFASILVAAAFIDWETLLLPDALTLGLLWVGLLVSALGGTVPPAEAIAGAVGGYALLWLVASGYRQLRHQEGMGQGDFKLLAALGAWLGWGGLLPVVVLASISAAVVGIALKTRGKLREGRLVPFGPFLGAAALVMVCWQGSRAGTWWL